MSGVFLRSYLSNLEIFMVGGFSDNWVLLDVNILFDFQTNSPECLASQKAPLGILTNLKQKHWECLL